MTLLMSLTLSTPSVTPQCALALERSGLDFLVIDPTADAMIAASWLIPVTARMGLVAALPTDHAQPFHAARALAAMDTLSSGRSGWQPNSHSSADAARRFDASPPLSAAAARARTLEYVAAARALWDSWDEDALVIDKPSAAYLHSEKIRRVDFRGEFFRVLGPLNAARPPQGHPVLVIDDEDPAFDELATEADVLLIAADDVAVARERVSGLHRDGARLVFLKVQVAPAAAPSSTGPALRLPTDAVQGARRVLEWQRAIGCDGVHLETAGTELPPAALASNLERLLLEIRRLAPAPSAENAGPTLRSRLGLAQAANRYHTR